MAQVGFDLGTIVEPEYSGNHVLELGGNLDRSGASAISTSRIFVLLQVDGERLVEVLDRAGEDDGAARSAFFDHDQPMFARELLDLIEIGGVGIMDRAEITIRTALLLGRNPTL